MKEQLLRYYTENQELLRFKGNRPGEDPSTRINEYAIVGDKWLAYQIAGLLVNKGYDNSSVTIAMSSVLSNSHMSDVAKKLGLPTGASSHSTGTLLEAMVGLWAQASFNFDNRHAADFYESYQPLFDWLIVLLLNEAVEHLAATSISSVYSRNK